MKIGVPKPASVDSAFRLLQKRLAGAVKRVNNAAAAATKSGDYETAQRWMEIGRSVADFAGRATAYADEWKRLVQASRVAAGVSEGRGGEANGAPREGRHTPAWRFYTPVLRALAAHGSAMSSSDLLAAIEREITPQLKERDLRAGGAKAAPRWHRTVLRMRRLFQREGWIEKGRGEDWAITDKGKDIARADVSHAPP